MSDSTYLSEHEVDYLIQAIKKHHPKYGKFAGIGSFKFEIGNKVFLLSYRDSGYYNCPGIYELDVSGDRFSIRSELYTKIKVALEDAKREEAKNTFKDLIDEADNAAEQSSVGKLFNVNKTSR